MLLNIAQQIMKAIVKKHLGLLKIQVLSVSRYLGSLEQGPSQVLEAATANKVLSVSSHLDLQGQGASQAPEQFNNLQV